MGGMGFAPPMPAAASYEFNDAENVTIASTARFARMWGIISLATGVLTLIIGVLLVVLFAAATTLATASTSGPTAMKPAMIVAIGASLIPSSLVSIIGGIFYLRSGASLQRVVETQGNDIPLLVDAVRALSRAFMIEAIAMMVGFVIGLVIGIAMQIGAH